MRSVFALAVVLCCSVGSAFAQSPAFLTLDRVNGETGVSLEMAASSYTLPDEDVGYDWQYRSYVLHVGAQRMLTRGFGVYLQLPMGQYVSERVGKDRETRIDSLELGVQFVTRKTPFAKSVYHGGFVFPTHSGVGWAQSNHAQNMTYATGRVGDWSQISAYGTKLRLGGLHELGSKAVTLHITYGLDATLKKFDDADYFLRAGIGALINVSGGWGVLLEAAHITLLKQLDYGFQPAHENSLTAGIHFHRDRLSASLGATLPFSIGNAEDAHSSGFGNIITPMASMSFTW